MAVFLEDFFLDWTEYSQNDYLNPASEKPTGELFSVGRDTWRNWTHFTVKVQVQVEPWENTMSGDGLCDHEQMSEEQSGGRLRLQGAPVMIVVARKSQLNVSGESQ